MWMRAAIVAVMAGALVGAPALAGSQRPAAEPADESATVAPEASVKGTVGAYLTALEQAGDVDAEALIAATADLWADTPAAGRAHRRSAETWARWRPGSWTPIKAETDGDTGWMTVAMVPSRGAWADGDGASVTVGFRAVRVGDDWRLSGIDLPRH